MKIRKSRTTTCQGAAGDSQISLTFLAQVADSHVFCYSNADVCKGKEADEIFRCIEFWTRRHGTPPQHPVFDSTLTTFAGLGRLDADHITFITLRRRSPNLIAEINQLPPSAWRRQITLDVAHRKYQTPRVFEQKARPLKRVLPTALRQRSRSRPAHHPLGQRY